MLYIQYLITVTNHNMGKLNNPAAGKLPTLLLEIQNPADVEQAIRILNGEEPTGDIRCIQL